LTGAEANLIKELQHRIKHVIYLVKENRTYDQVLGGLDRGKGDPSLADFGQEIIPNYHALAKQFVDLDNFYNTGDVIGDGHIWSFGGRENNLSQRSAFRKTTPVGVQPMTRKAKTAILTWACPIKHHV
jgi:hypothetical protein